VRSRPPRLSSRSETISFPTPQAGFRLSPPSPPPSAHLLPESYKWFVGLTLPVLIAGYVLAERDLDLPVQVVVVLILAVAVRHWYDAEMFSLPDYGA
jgi:hypothetical protein